MVVDHLLCALLWIVFCVLHSVLASGAVKRKTQAAAPAFFPYYRLAYTLFAFASFAAVVWYQWHMDPIWVGNGGQVKQRVDFVDFDHVYISGIDK